MLDKYKEKNCGSVKQKPDMNWKVGIHSLFSSSLSQLCLALINWWKINYEVVHPFLFIVIISTNWFLLFSLEPHRRNLTSILMDNSPNNWRQLCVSVHPQSLKFPYYSGCHIVATQFVNGNVLHASAVWVEAHSWSEVLPPCFWI